MTCQNSDEREKEKEKKTVKERGRERERMGGREIDNDTMDGRIES